MDKIKNLEDLRKVREDMQLVMASRIASDTPEEVIQIKVGMATNGIAAGAKETMNHLIAELDKRQIKAIVYQVGDMGKGNVPTIEVTLPGKDAVVFGNVDIARANKIIDTYIAKGEMCEGAL